MDQQSNAPKLQWSVQSNFDFKRSKSIQICSIWIYSFLSWEFHFFLLRVQFLSLKVPRKSTLEILYCQKFLFRTSCRFNLIVRKLLLEWMECCLAVYSFTGFFHLFPVKTRNRPSYKKSFFLETNPLFGNRFKFLRIQIFENSVFQRNFFFKFDLNFIAFTLLSIAFTSLLHHFKDLNDFCQAKHVQYPSQGTICALFIKSIWGNHTDNKIY